MDAKTGANTKTGKLTVGDENWIVPGLCQERSGRT